MAAPQQSPQPFVVEELADHALGVSGELDLASAPQLTAALARHLSSGHCEIVLDLTNLQFCDSSGLSVFVQAHRELRSAGGRLKLHNASPHLRTLLTATALDQEFDID